MMQKKTDTLYYKLSKNASDILDRLIANHHPVYIYLSSNSFENNYHFVFSLIKKEVKSEKDDYIVEHSNRFLKTTKNVLKIYLEEDKRFLDSPENKMNYISHYPTAGVVVDAQGELLSYYSEEYKLKPPSRASTPPMPSEGKKKTKSKN